MFWQAIQEMPHNLAHLEKVERVLADMSVLSVHTVRSALTNSVVQLQLNSPPWQPVAPLMMIV